MPAITVEQAFQMATAHFRAGQLQEAEAMCRKILAAQPNHTEAWLQLGEVCLRLGQEEEATACSRHAIQLYSQSLSACVNLGNTLMARGRLSEAIAAFEQALQIEPDRPEVHYNLGNAYAKACDWDKAIACYHRALALRPDYKKAYANLGFVYLEQNRLNEALANFELQPDGPEKSYNKGVALSRMGRSEEAIACYQEAIALRPEYADALWALSSELLLVGRFEEGWRIHARYGQCQHESVSRWKSQAPQWDGSRLNGETVLIYEEQGHGDTIHFLRYLPVVRERAGACHLLLDCPPLLCRLLKQNDASGIEVLDHGHPAGGVPRFERQISFLDLPFALQHWKPMPVAGPYLQANPATRATWRDKLRASPFRVGVAWAGNSRHPNDRRRSMSPEKLYSLLGVPGVAFYSLQVKPEDGQPKALPEAGLIDLAASITDFADTAALISELDLVISVDTAVAHLAGALGRPVWTLIPFVPDWRWGKHGDDTPWYPTMRLFRQPAPDDWDAVIHHIFEELTALTRKCTPRGVQ